MSFGRNPHVAKAQTAEQKARAAGDDTAKALAWREAARHWDRSAERETDAKRRGEYERNAESAREFADNGESNDGDEAKPAIAPADGPRNSKSLN